MVASQRCSPTAAPYGVVYNHHDQESTTYVPEEIQACANRLKSRVPEDCSIEQWTEALHQEVPAVPRPVDMTDTPPLFPCHRLLSCIGCINGSVMHATATSALRVDEIGEGSQNPEDPNPTPDFKKTVPGEVFGSWFARCPKLGNP